MASPLPVPRTPHILSFPLPDRCWQKSADGTWTGYLWRLPDVHSALQGGGWFDPEGDYRFDSRETRDFAFASQIVRNQWGIPTRPAPKKEAW